MRVSTGGASAAGRRLQLTVTGQSLVVLAATSSLRYAHRGAQRHQLVPRRPHDDEFVEAVSVRVSGRGAAPRCRRGNEFVEAERCPQSRNRHLSLAAMVGGEFVEAGWVGSGRWCRPPCHLRGGEFVEACSVRASRTSSSPALAASVVASSLRLEVDHPGQRRGRRAPLVVPATASSFTQKPRHLMRCRGFVLFGVYAASTGCSNPNSATRSAPPSWFTAFSV
ncbi:Uncharacterised protein [Mycobacteroides abscessus subsp. abscessus]|nr:Uncharacterised protein [Mycobacteroides abscessus subsp. abscessus]SIC58841.1 Uncharacterised protein [Mycobacteroides abscessus subsp. abscessus]SKK19537.1 Uncharacterised protein [Mycobacteroides abscessus subsp. abscessus]SKP49632.1 Uncharacterised protein [Mycobacteroides abscessus subsp. abscessus]SKR42299.1 Uncharacterised protein [Mycobacteroides abscessus subsp. abscessus]